MSYAIVAEHHGISIFNRARTAVEALELAVSRRRSGAEAVYVRDSAWALVPASTLERAAEIERAGYATPSRNTSNSVRDSVTTEPTSERPVPNARAGRVRVFKAAGAQRTRD